jgi:pyridoxamine 5'-phosphate oxidase
MPLQSDAPPADLPHEAVGIFSTWYKTAMADRRIEDANAMALATADETGLPSCRMVLLKSFDAGGFVFYTNLGSRKGCDLQANPRAAICFHWSPLGRQVRIEGGVTGVTLQEADTYFASRLRSSQIGAWASRQSQCLESPSILLSRIARRTVQFAAQPVPRPDFWSGYRVRPDRVEFWSEGSFRIHHRRVFALSADHGWRSLELFP